MKSLILLVFTFTFSYSAMACPNLAGTYKACEVEKAGTLPEMTVSDVTISQRMSSAGHTEYILRSKIDGDFGTNIYTADGELHHDGSISSLSRCNDSILDITLYTDNGRTLIGKLEFIGHGDKELYYYMGVSMGGLNGYYSVTCK